MINKSTPISVAGHENLTKPRTIVDTESNPFWSPALYALGWNVGTYHGEVIIEHSGGTSGFGCQMMVVPGKRWGVVIFTNTMDGSNANDKICYALIDDMLDIPIEKRFNWDEDAAKSARQTEEDRRTVEKLYPKIPEPRVPLTLPLKTYAGEYTHEGYGTLVVQWKDGQLLIDSTDRTWRHVMTFKHVSGEFFAVEKLDIDQHFKDLVRAEFRLDAEGLISQLGIDFVEELEGEMIWFRKTVRYENGL